VLVVDDDPGRAHGHRALALGTGPLRGRDRRARAGRPGLKTAAFKPHLLVLDWRLGDTTGEQVVATIRGLPGIAQPKILIVSAHLRQPTSRGVLAAGADDFLAKPFELEVLRATVLRLLGLAVRSRRGERRRRRRGPELVDLCRRSCSAWWRASPSSCRSARRGTCS
jgi:DNA-binding response OmpR family regulator